MTEISKGENQAINDTDQTVLVAVDFSEDSRAALLWACRYTKSAKVRLVVLHVINDRQPSSYEPAVWNCS